MDESHRQTVLVVDDSQSIRFFCEKLLQRDGYSIAQAVNGMEAIEIAHSVMPHVIIMDVMMPVMDGLEAIRRLRENPITSRIPIIIISAKAEEQDITDGLIAGADEYLSKPIRAREFQLRVRSMVRLREAQLELEQANTSLQRRSELLTKLNQFYEAVLLENSVEMIHEKIVETAAELLQSDRVSLLIPDQSQQSLHIAYAKGIDEQAWAGLRIPLTSPISGKVFSTQNEMVVNRDTPHPPTIGRYESACFISVPLVCAALRGKKGPIGVLNVTEKRDDADYQAEDIQALRQLAQTAAMALDQALTRRQLDETRDSIIFSMAKLSEYRHQETGKHLERVRELSIALARHLANDPRIPETIDEYFIIDLGRATPLHDIGKVAIPDSILLKKGKLTDEEFQTMQNHTVIGAETLRSVIAGGHDASFLQVAMEIARHHHERYDGKGYPDRLARDQIPLGARIVCLTDSYDAIRMEREYKPARSHEEASREILKASGGQFDPRLVHAFCALEEEFEAIYARYTEKKRDDASADELVFAAASA